MEEHALVASLHRSREELREVLMPGASSGRVLHGRFPRSAVMRFLLDSKKRKLVGTVLGALVLRRRSRS